jgi:hypothetical protein
MPIAVLRMKAKRSKVTRLGTINLASATIFVKRANTVRRTVKTTNGRSAVVDMYVHSSGSLIKIDCLKTLFIDTIPQEMKNTKC